MLPIAESYCSYDAADGPRLILFRLPSPRQLHRQVPTLLNRRPLPSATPLPQSALTELSSPEPKKATADSFEATDGDEQDAFKRRTEPSVHQRRITEYEAVGSVVIEKDRPVGQKAGEAEVQITQRPSAKKRERGK